MGLAMIRDQESIKALEYQLLKLLTHFGNLPCAKICFPQYFGITRRYMQYTYSPLHTYTYAGTTISTRVCAMDWPGQYN